METPDDAQQKVQEVRVHAISLRRPRGKKRTAAPPSPPPVAWTTRVSGGLRSSLSIALEPPRQGWLVALGLSSLAIKGTTHAWTTLVREGTEAETELSRLIDVAARRTGISSSRHAKDSRRSGR
jgi:hypothetical protein